MTDKIDELDLQDINEMREFLRDLSSKDFLNFGAQDVAYIRPIVVDGQKAYAVHAGDGTQLSIMESLDMAEAIARHSDLETVQVH